MTFGVVAPLITMIRPAVCCVASERIHRPGGKSKGGVGARFRIRPREMPAEKNASRQTTVAFRSRDCPRNHPAPFFPPEILQSSRLFAEPPRVGRSRRDHRLPMFSSDNLHEDLKMGMKIRRTPAPPIRPLWGTGQRLEPEQHWRRLLYGDISHDPSDRRTCCNLLPMHARGFAAPSTTLH
jgi:hypothetical protein